MISTKAVAKKNSQCEPHVTPFNNTHLYVSWENSFEEGCRNSDIERMTIIIRKGFSNSRYIVEADFEKKHHEIEANPCFQHSLFIYVFLKRNHSETHGRSLLRLRALYNDKRDHDNYPYAGLIASQVVPGICLQENGTISIPDPPQALENCGVLKGDVGNSSFQEAGSSALIIIMHFNNPREPTIKIPKCTR